MLIGWIESNLTNMFTDVNEKVGTIAAEVGQTPSGWNGGVYQMIRGLSENVIVPIAGIIITFVLCYELISMITEKNNLHDMDTWMFFKWFFKAAVAIYLVTHTFDIVMQYSTSGRTWFPAQQESSTATPALTLTRRLRRCVPAWRTWASENCSDCR